MADVFVSYSSNDRETVALITAGLTRSGFDVWWDQRLSPGNRFTDEMEIELEAARAILVVWSSSSVKSMWVADEASVGRDKGNLVPLCIESVLPAMGFRQLHAIDFQRWSGDITSPEFVHLTDSLTKVVAGGRADYVQDSPGSRAADQQETPNPPQRAANAARAGLRAALLCAVLAAVALGLWFYRPDLTQSQKADQDSSETAITGAATTGLAVIPFSSLSSEADQALFADGLSEELLNWLGHVEGLRVPGRSSAFRFKDKNEDIRVIGQQLNVDYVLEGSVRQSGTNLRISAQLSEATGGGLIWSESFDRQLTDLFQVQDEIAQTVARELLGKLPDTGTENPAFIGDVDPSAHELYLQGRALWSKRQLSALEKFRQAVAIDPQHWLAQAYVAIVGAVAETASFESERVAQEVRATTTHALSEAVRLRPEAADVLFAQGWVIERRQPLTDGRLKDPMAIDFMQRAIQANPRHSEALHALARVDQPPQQKADLFKTIVDMDPGHGRAWFNLVGNTIETGEYSRARDLARNMLTSAPYMPLRMTAYLSKRLGDMEMVSTLVFENWDVTDNDRQGRRLRAAMLADQGAVAEAEFLYRREVEKNTSTSATDLILAEILADNQPARLAAARAMYENTNGGGWSGLMLAAALLATDQPQEAWDLISAERSDLQSDSPQFQEAKWSALGDPDLYVAAEALDFLGRGDEARRLWTFALESSPEVMGGTWKAPLNRALLHARLGNNELAAASFAEAYRAGFRFLYSYHCEACIHDGFASDLGMFAPLLKIPEAAKIVEQIQVENRRLLERLNQRFGILDRVRQEMEATQAPE